MDKGPHLMVVGYARVSTENQLENYSIDEQTTRLAAYCKAKGWTLLHTYVDGGFSGGNTNRPALQQMLRAVREQKIDAVVVYKLDRLSRSQKDTLTLIEDELLAHGTDFVSINENFDTSTPFGRAMIGILSVFAQLEKDQITERFLMGRMGRGKAGYFHGGGNAPTGYDYVDGLLRVNEYEAIQVRELFQRFLDGQSINAIMRALNQRYTTKWTAAKVRNVLRNSLYIGKVNSFGAEYDGVHPPLVDTATFQEANRLFENSRREIAQHPTLKNPFRAGYLLSGLVRCARCGARYSANHGYYKCYSRAKSSPKFVVDPNCKNDNWPIEELDALVVGQVNALVSDDSLLDAVVSRHDEPVKVDKDAIRRQLQELDRQLSKLIDLYQVGGIPMEAVTSRAKDLSAQRDALQAQLDAPDAIPACEMFLNAVKAYKAGFVDGDTDKRRLLLGNLIRSVIIDGRSVRMEWRL